MANPQVHFGIGMIITLIVIFVIMLIIKNRNIRKYMFITIPIILIFSGAFSVIPDTTDLLKSYPSVYNFLGLEKQNLKDAKSHTHSPYFNIFFFHPAIDLRYNEFHDTLGLIITLITFNLLMLLYINKNKILS